jgi:hypothetical protein
MRSRASCLLLLLLLCSCASHDRAASIAPKPEDAVVRVEASNTSAPRSTISTGVIVGRGQVATTLTAIRGAKECWITTANSRRARITGVAALDEDNDLVLLAADWMGSPPPGLTPAQTLPATGAPVTVLTLEGADAPTRIRGTVAPTKSPARYRVSISGRAAIGYFGSPVFDDHDRLVGLVTDSVMGVGLQLSLNPVRVENELWACTLAALCTHNAWQVVPWEKWTQTPAARR